MAEGRILVEVPGLAEDRIMILQAAFDHYRDTEQWPILEKIARELVELDVDEIASGLGYPWVETHLSNNTPVALRLPALALCKGSEDIVSAFLATVHFAVSKYFTKGGDGKITQAMLVKEAGLSNQMAHHALVLFKSENLSSDMEGSVPGNWVLKIGSAIRRYRNVKTLDEYLERNAKTRGERIIPLGTRETFVDQPIAPNAGTFVPNTAFVMMWLAPENPNRDAIAQAIREAFAPYGILARHAMDFDEDTVVTNTILEQVKSAEHLVADLTGERPSVYYEIGFAHSLGKHPMLVRQSGTRIHFDLAVHNAPEYTDAADLKRMLLRRLNERIGPAPQRLISNPP